MQTLPPVVLSCIPKGLETATSTALTHLRTTHDSKKLEGYAEQYVKLLYSTITGSSAAESLKASGWQGSVKPERDDLAVVYQDFGPACYIDSSFPVTAHMLVKCDFRLCLHLSFNAAISCG
jgi:hypothetical protein